MSSFFIRRTRDDTLITSILRTNYLNVLTSNIQEQLDSKLSSVALNDITDWPPGVTSTEIGHLENTSTNIQNQFGTINTRVTTLESIPIPFITPPTYEGLDSAGMSLTIAREPLRPLDTFVAYIDGHTGDPIYELQLWKFSLNYDTSVLRVVSWSYTNLYSTPIEFFDPNVGELIAIANSIANGVDGSEVTNKTNLRLAEVTFEVLETVPLGVNSNVINLLCESMINQGVFEYVTDKPAEVVDFRSGTNTTGSIQVVTSLPQIVDLNIKVSSDITGITGAEKISNIVRITQEDYDAIGSPDPSIFFVITE